MPGGASLDRDQIRSFKKAWAEIDVNRTGYIRRKDFTRFFAKLNGVFEVRLYPTDYSVSKMMSEAVPDSNSKDVIRGTQHAIDLRKVQHKISDIDFNQVRTRRRAYARLYYEAKMSEEPGRGISFTNMLLMLAHYKLIDDEKALRVEDLLVRRARNERVDDLVNLDRVRGLIRTIYWRKRFLESRLKKQDGEYGLPTIVLEPIDSNEMSAPPSPQPSVHTIDGQYPIPLQRLSSRPRTPPSADASPPLSPYSSAPNSPSRSDGFSHDRSYLPSPSQASHMSGFSSGSRMSGLSTEEASRHISVEETDEDVLHAMSTSVWGGE